MRTYKPHLRIVIERDVAWVDVMNANILHWALKQFMKKYPMFEVPITTREVK